jgi:hypothetical protein
MQPPKIHEVLVVLRRAFGFSDSDFLVIWFLESMQLLQF